MKQHALHIEPYNHSASSKFVIEGYSVNGKRKRLFFASRSQAEVELARLKQVQRQEGQAGAELGPELRVEAARCIRLLAKYEKTLTDATDFLLAHLRSVEQKRASWSISRLVDEWIARLQRGGRSAVHVADVQQRLTRFAQTFGDRPAAELTPEEIETWIEELGLSARSFNNFHNRIFSLFEFAVKRELVADNPVRKIEPKTVRPSETQVIEPGQLQRLLDNAPAELIPPLAISYFAGLRTAEILRLEWDDVNLARGFIDVPASKAKSAQRRLVPMESNLMLWLSPYAKRLGKLYPRSKQQFYSRLSELYQSVNVERIDNSGRHSFASYWLASHNDSASLAARLGHPTSKLVYSVYRELVSPEEAAAYWAVKPAREANVIALGA
jgi:integrase